MAQKVKTARRSSYLNHRLAATSPSQPPPSSYKYKDIQCVVGVILCYEHDSCRCLDSVLLSTIQDPLYVSLLTIPSTADRKEFIKISQAVGMGFLIMGAIGYFIKLSTIPPLSCLSSLQDTRWLIYSPVHIPVNNVLVG